MNERTTYKLARAHALVALGVSLIVVAAVVVLTLVTRDSVGWVPVTVTLVWVVAGIAVGASLLLLVVRPTVAVLDDREFQAKVRVGAIAGKPQGERFIAWGDVSEVDTHDGVVELHSESGGSVLFALDLLDASQRVDFMREIHDRLNNAHGYRRL